MVLAKAAPPTHPPAGLGGGGGRSHLATTPVSVHATGSAESGILKFGRRIWSLLMLDDFIWDPFWIFDLLCVRLRCLVFSVFVFFFHAPYCVHSGEVTLSKSLEVLSMLHAEVRDSSRNSMMCSDSAFFLALSQASRAAFSTPAHCLLIT